MIKESPMTKEKLKRGTGHGAGYVPYFTTSEFSSKGTTSVIKDWKTGRGVHCMSQGEAQWYYLLRWDDSTEDIREQFPLNKKLVADIALKNNLPYSYSDETYCMTTDFLLTRVDGSVCACSIKYSKEELFNNCRELKNINLERLYWKMLGVEYRVLFAVDVNFLLYNNISLVVPFYNEGSVFDKYSALKHLIAIKKSSFDIYRYEVRNDNLDKFMKGELS